MLVDDLKMLLGSSFVFYTKAHGFHFNVEGPDFVQYHDFLGKIYSDVYGTIDVLGEYIRTLGEYAPGALSRYLELSKIPEQVQIPSAMLMMAEMLRDNSIMIELLKHCFSSAESENNQGVANFLAERLDAHEKHGWMLRSILKKDRA